MLIVDAHLDLAWNALDWNRDLLRPVSEIRARECELKMTGKGRGENTVAFPDLRRGGVGLFIATLLARLLRPNLMPTIQRYERMEAAYAAAHGQMTYYRLLEQQGVLRWIKDVPTLDAHVAAWNKNPQSEPLGFILSMEGADPVLSPEQVEEWYQAGLRIIGPAHYGVSPYAHGTGTEGGLFPRGPALLKEMQRVGMILDVTHLSDQCFDEALDIYGGPVLASHHNCRALVPGSARCKTDEEIRKVTAAGGVIGVTMVRYFVSSGSSATIENVLDHIDHVAQLAGVEHAGIGSDVDLQGRDWRSHPSKRNDLDGINYERKIYDLTEGLVRRKYSDRDIQLILGGNFQRALGEIWAV